jgi:RNA polymerase sigma-70 factor, ECF subfamily
MAKDYTEYSDDELFYLLKNEGRQAEEAFGELYNRLSPRIFAYCRRFLGNKEEAQDIFQETFVKFFQSGKQEREMTNVPAFALKIARNLCVNSKRKEKTAVSFEDYMVVKNENRTEQDELLNLIKMALDLLQPEYREMFILREYEGLSYTDIAEMTNIPLSTVKIRIFRAKQKIREILSPYLEDLSKFE